MGTSSRKPGSSPRARGTLEHGARGRHGHRFIPASAGNTAFACLARTTPAVHPRERGEHRVIRLSIWADTGSSPRARGTRGQKTGRRTRCRFIPASAGNTDTMRPRSLHAFGSSPRARGTPTRPPAIRSWCAVHPRERGEHHLGAAGAGAGVRFIPASAGNTTPPFKGARGGVVHPRERGEHGREHVQRLRALGSSPRARGTLLLVPHPATGRRFIPASAGNTPRTCRSMAQSAVHPRERGEHWISTRPVSKSAGSSPRARGTRRPQPHRGGRRRFIPASAGNTYRGSAPLRKWTVHPRERGEHSINGFSRKGVAGSSPRARGTPVRWPHLAAPARFIPASAGNTICRPNTSAPKAVHPRERGEHLDVVVVEVAGPGSSPRARGTH